MAGLAKEFEQLGCWESATEEENIVIYDLEDIAEEMPTEYEILKPQEIHSLIAVPFFENQKLVDAKASLVAACYSEDDCFYWGKELENFAAWQHMCNEYKPGSSALLHALEVYELPKNKTK